MEGRKDGRIEKREWKEGEREWKREEGRKEGREGGRERKERRIEEYTSVCVLVSTLHTHCKDLITVFNLTMEFGNVVTLVYI